MKRSDRVFGGIRMTWIRVILFAVLAGVYTGVINQIPVLRNTSFQDIAVSMEWWILFALLISANVKSAPEAAVKIFVFFLISQPLVYLVELPHLGWTRALVYYRGWMFPTLLTLPGGFAAWYAKKESLIGSVILSFATGLLAALGYDYLRACMMDFPHHLLTMLFCFAQCLMLLLVFKKKTVWRLVVIVLTAAALFAGIYLYKSDLMMENLSLPEGNWTCITEFTDGSRMELQEDVYRYIYNRNDFKDKVIEFENENGEVYAIRAFRREEDGTVWLIPESAAEAQEIRTEEAESVAGTTESMAETAASGRAPAGSQW